MENLEFLDTPVHIHIHVVTMHECKTIMMTVLIVSVQQITVLLDHMHVSFVRNIAHVRFFSSRVRKFLNRENLC